MKLSLLRKVAPPQSDNKVANSGPSIYKYVVNILYNKVIILE